MNLKKGAPPPPPTRPPHPQLKLRMHVHYSLAVRLAEQILHSVISKIMSISNWIWRWFIMKQCCVFFTPWKSLNCPMQVALISAKWFGHEWGKNLHVASQLRCFAFRLLSQTRLTAPHRINYPQTQQISRKQHQTVCVSFRLNALLYPATPVELPGQESLACSFSRIKVSPVFAA